MKPIDKIKKKIEDATPVTWADLAECFQQDQRTIRAWIQDNCPEINLKSDKRKVTFAPAEAKAIITEWYGA